MSTIQVEMLEGRTLEQKRQMVKEVSEVVSRTINCDKGAVKIIIREMKSKHFAIGGVLISDSPK